MKFLNYIVTRKNLNVKRIAIQVTTISFLVNLPVASLIRTYAIAPTAIPLDIEYVRGIMISAKNAGTAALMSDISTFAKFLSIRTPT